MEHSDLRSESQSFAATGGQVNDNARKGTCGSGSSISESVARGKEAIGTAANEAINAAGSDLQSLRADLNSLKDTFAKFVSQSGNEAAKSAREVTSNVAGQIGGMASDLADKGTEMASAASDQVKSFGSELENMARRNPIGALADRDRRTDRSDGASKLMLFKVLKLFGLDIPAKIDAVRADLELRVEQATDHVKQVAQEAAVIAAFSATASVTGAMAVGVGLIALYRWTTVAYGAYAGLGIVGAILVVVAVIFAIGATIRGKSLAGNRTKLSRYASGKAGVTTHADAIKSASGIDAAAGEPSSGSYAWEPPTAATRVSPTASASDLVEPLAFLLSKVVKYPTSAIR